jgi:hypothetical protein
MITRSAKARSGMDCYCFYFEDSVSPELLLTCRVSVVSFISKVSLSQAILL